MVGGGGVGGGGPPGLFPGGFNVGGSLARMPSSLGSGGMASSNSAALAGVPLGVAPSGGRGDLLAAIAMGLPGLQGREADRFGLDSGERIAFMPSSGHERCFV